MAAILEVKDLCKTYITNKRQNNVLRNVSFSVDEGEMVAVMGPSGSGKSTLLYTVSGMDGMTAGEVEFVGRDISRMKPRELARVRLNEMGFIFQQMYMLKNLSVLDNILLPARQSKAGRLSPKQKLERAKELMRREVMKELCAINADGTTVMLVTHDAKVAAKCSRVLYIVDGNIQGEYRQSGSDARQRERALNNWLLEMGF